MVKDTEDFRNTKCAICWQVLRPKSPLLHGMKCIRFEIKKKLRLLLPLQDFRNLYDESIFPNPRICNMCFVTIRKIPKTIAKLQGLLGKKINTRLYKPHRSEWNDSSCDSVQTSNGRTEHSSSTTFSQLKSQSKTPSQTSHVGAFTESKPKLGKKKVSNCERLVPLPAVRLQNPVNEGLSESDHVDTFDDLEECDYQKDLKPTHNSVTLVSSSETIAARRKSNKEVEVTDNKLSSRVESSPSQDETFTSSNHVTNTCHQSRRREQKTSSETKMRKKRHSLKQEPQESNKADDKRLKGNYLLRKTNRTTKLENESKKSVTLRRTRNMTRLRETEESVDSGQISNYGSESEDEYIPSSLKTTKSKGIVKLSCGLRRKTTLGLPGKRQSLVSNKLHKYSLALTENKGQNSKQLILRLSKSKLLDKCRKVASTVTHFKDDCKITKPPTIKVDIPAYLNETSMAKLRDLAEKAMLFLEDRKDNFSERMMIRCSINGCDHKYPLWHHMAVHVKYYHHNGVFGGDDDFTKKMFMLADFPQLDKEIYQFRCRQADCSLAFTSDELLQEHESHHGTEFELSCGFPDCTKAFKLPRPLYIHYRSHTGERPFLCMEPACEKTFKDAKELSKHKSRHAGEKPYKCDTDQCDKAFFTVSELKSHRTIHVKSESFCCDVCGKQYANEKGLVRHKRRIHGFGKPGRHRCPYEDCNESFVKKEKLEIHMCTHSPERQLFCEKCGKKFSCQRYLDVHYKIHIKNENHAVNPPARSIQCDFAGCGKMFTTRENMKSHVLNQHRGRKPKAIPGVFFSCTAEGCGKQFSFRSTLYRHNKLVHKGGDYKLGREVVKYACTYEGCCKEFNRKNLLEEHMVMEHGKSPKRLLPLQNRELDFIERICMHCGMALTIAQLPRHEEVYHNDKASKEMKENSHYPCHLKGCDQVFNTCQDRISHVQEHIDNPPYRCQVGGCTETFFLEKNLDNHLWCHSKKASTCDFEGCLQTFQDQLQLAKHSKIHYDGKMKCPWPNCDNWLTETGHLKPHFLAHSRSLRANLDSDFVCEICELAFSSKWGLMIHKRMHGEEAAGKPSLSKLVKFECEEDGCQATFADQKGFFDHFLFHYTNTPAACDFTGCTESFRNLITMSRHTKCHHDGKFKCPWQGCAKMFASVFIVKKHLYRHIMSDPVVASNRQYPCGQCFMKFRSERNHASHQEHHNEKSDYVCPTCGKKGRHNHMKTHRPGSRPSKSQECQQCGALYATISGLKFHLLQKHKIGKWPFKCDYCGKGFVSSREMQRHIPSHTKEKPFTCEICRVSFASHTGHRAHMRKHTGQKYVCDIDGCGKMYTTPISLRGHKAQHAGFSKTCHYCFKTYKNPYGHKCKASRDNKRKMAEQGQNQMSSRSPVTLQGSALQAAPILPQPAVTPLTQSMIPSTSTAMQHTVIMPQQIITHTMDVQQAARTIMAPNTLTRLIPTGLAEDVTQDLTQNMPQTLTHGLPNQGIVQGNEQSTAMDMTRGNPMDITGDYTFNNYVVFWDSANIS